MKAGRKCSKLVQNHLSYASFLVIRLLLSHNNKHPITIVINTSNNSKDVFTRIKIAIYLKIICNHAYERMPITKNMEIWTPI
jgi:hypothetical protein